jgi:FkbM family methyltransferase
MRAVLLRRLFLLVARLVRGLPTIRGKVRAAQAVYRMANRANAPFLITTTLYPEAFRFRLNLTSAHERMAFLMNGYEPETTELLDRMYENGTVLDVGANVGLVAVPLAARTRDRADRLPHVIAFEALPSNHEALVWNLSANHLESVVQAFPLALGAERKRVKIQIEGDDPARTGTANILPSAWDFKQIDLEVYRIDDLVEEEVIPRDVTVVKIDTDGYDLEVLRGARTMLEQQRPICLAELNLHCLGWHQQTLDDVLRFAEDVRYRVLTQTGYNSGVFVLYRPGTAFFDNALLVPYERVDEPRIRAITFQA